MNITDISGIGNATARVLKTHGIASVEAVAQASIEQLVAVPGIGEGRAAALRESAHRLLSDALAGAESPEAASTPDAEDGSESVAAPVDDGAEAKEKKDGKGKKGKKDKKARKKEGKAEKKKAKKKKKDKGRRKKKNKRK